MLASVSPGEAMGTGSEEGGEEVPELAMMTSHDSEEQAPKARSSREHPGSTACSLDSWTATDRQMPEGAWGREKQVGLPGAGI